ncbi:MAG: HD domain-containing protein [Oscillospiraceae bacterium]|nr:HD domain-containing protein [Oscillospiraceae bacterium]
MNFKEIGNAGQVEGFAVIKQCDRKTAKNGNAYLDMVLSDRDGEISAKLWDYTEVSHGKYEADMFVKIRGTLLKYNGNDQLRIERIRPVIDSDNVRISDYVKSADYSGEDMMNFLVSTVNAFKNDDLKKLVLYLLDENKEKILYFPAAYRLHHAIRCGLLMHTASIVRLCEGICKVYPFVNRELLISGAILHDIAKTTEFEVRDSGLASGYTVEGNLIGHLVKGAMMVEKAAEKLSIDKELSLLLQHMVLSHHGEPDFGAAVRPQFLEAELLSQLDLMDARVYEIMSAVENVEKGEFSQRLWALEDRRFYKYNDTPLKVDIL